MKTYNLQSDRQINYVIDAKPKIVYLLLVLIGYYISYRYGPSYSIIFIALSWIMYFAMPTRVILELSKDYMIVYNRASKEDCLLVYYEDIVSWKYLVGKNNDILEFELVDGRKEKVEGFSKKIFEKYLNKYIKDKRVEK